MPQGAIWRKPTPEEAARAEKQAAQAIQTLMATWDSLMRLRICQICSGGFYTRPNQMLAVCDCGQEYLQTTTGQLVPRN